MKGEIKIEKMSYNIKVKKKRMEYDKKLEKKK
jgi:hypothetical protein